MRATSLPVSEPDDTPIEMRWRDAAGEHAATKPLAEVLAAWCGGG